MDSCRLEIKHMLSYVATYLFKLPRKNNHASFVLPFTMAIEICIIFRLLSWQQLTTMFVSIFHIRMYHLLDNSLAKVKAFNVRLKCPKKLMENIIPCTIKWPWYIDTVSNFASVPRINYRLTLNHFSKLLYDLSQSSNSQTIAFYFVIHA